MEKIVIGVSPVLGFGTEQLLGGGNGGASASASEEGDIWTSSNT